MRVHVVTTWEPGFAGAARFLRSFVRHWPEWATLHLFYEGEAPIDCESGAAIDPARVVLHSLDADFERAAFLDGAPPDGFDYRQNARKFSHKVFAYTAPQVRDCDVLIWLDADTETAAPVTEEWVAAVTAGDCCYLGRKHYEHSECGFLSFRMPQAAPLLDAIRRLYTTRRILLLRGKTDCHAFDVTRARFEKEGMGFNNLSANAGFELHVWPNTRLAECLVHHKGPKAKAAAYGG